MNYLKSKMKKIQAFLFIMRFKTYNCSIKLHYKFSTLNVCAHFDRDLLVQGVSVTGIHLGQMKVLLVRAKCCQTNPILMMRNLLFCSEKVSSLPRITQQVRSGART